MPAEALRIAEWYDNNPVVQGLIAAAYERGHAAGLTSVAADADRLRVTLTEIARYADARAVATDMPQLLHAALGSIAYTARRAARIAEEGTDRAGD